MFCFLCVCVSELFIDLLGVNNKCGTAHLQRRKGQRGQNAAAQQDSLYPLTQDITGHFIVLSGKRSKLGHTC